MASGSERTAKRASNPSVTPRQPQKPHKPAASAKPTQKPQKPASSLEERKARIRAEAKTRRRAAADAPKPAHQKDSTEQPSLMKPYYLNDD